MKPPWPAHRVRTEFNAILAVDSRTHGPIAVRHEVNVTPAKTFSINDWQTENWVCGDTPEHVFLVDQLVIQGLTHMIAAEGGAGKTSIGLELCLKIAAEPEATRRGITLTWMGKKVINGGRVVMILNEDCRVEIHRRLKVD